MKIKQQPEDFVVDEITSFEPDTGGKYFVYHLHKRGMATMEALRQIAKQSRVPFKTLSAAGMKDKHSVSRQYFSAESSLPLEHNTDDLNIRFVGRSSRRLTAGFIDGNRFQLVLRNLQPDECQRIADNAVLLKDHGLPNYYDNQRFGGVAGREGFIGKALVLGNFEEALRLHLAVPVRKQSLRDKQNRKLAAKLWGDWNRLHTKMKRSSERALVEWLIDNPTDFAGCFERITPTLRSMFVAAYQSYIFNRALSDLVRASSSATGTVLNKVGPMVFPLDPTEDNPLVSLNLPLVGAGTKLGDGPGERAIQTVLDDEGITLAMLELPDLPRTRFRAAMRPAMMTPMDMVLSDPRDDDLNKGRLCLDLSFSLPRGSFATIVTRRLNMNPDHAAD